MIRTKLWLRLVGLFGIMLLLMLGAGLAWIDHNERKKAESQIEESTDQTAKALAATLKSLMLAGEGDIAHDWLERVKRSTGFDDVRIYRSDGIEAFLDNATINRVNAWRGKQLFTPHKRIQRPENISQTLNDAFATAVSGTPARVRRGNHLTILLPIRRELVCQQCHGYETMQVRGVLKLSVPTSEMALRLASQRRGTVWLAGTIILASGLLLLWLLNREVIRPVNWLRAAADKIKEGDISYRVSLDRNDELGDLSVAFDLMMDRLQRKIMQQRMVAEAVTDLSRELAGESVLRHVGELAMQISGVRYAVLSFLIEDEKKIIPLGIGDSVLDQLQKNPPQGMGLLGLPWNRRKTVRVDDIKGYADSVGFPVSYPPITSMLGVPIEFAGEMIGAIYLFDRRDGEPFNRNDEEIAQMLASACATALVNARQFERLKSVNEGLEESVERRTRELNKANHLLRNREIELELMNEELRHASEAKNQFLANTSHELRTPLNAIIGFSDLLLTMQSEKMTVKQKEYVEYINTGGKQLLTLINALLDLSKIEAGMLEVNEESAVAGDLLDRSVSQIRPLIDKKRLEISIVKPENEPVVYIDTSKLHQIWVNLIGNAIKFTHEGGCIKAGFKIIPGDRGMDAMMECYVEDTGIGISPANIERIFEPFVQAEGGLTRKFGGTGLGLALVRRLLEIQGGSIRVESEPGEGSSFIFNLPVNVADTGKETVASVGDDARSGVAGDRQTFDLEVLEESMLEEAPKPLVLIVDDNKPRASAVRVMLHEENYEGIVCDMEDAERLVQKKCPFLMMVGMPDDPEDIYRRLHMLRSRKTTRNVPLVLLGGDASAPHFSLGTVDTAEKRMTRNDLVDMISRYGHYSSRPAVMTVLIIDDEASVRSYMREALHGQGYRILMAANGRDGINAAIEHEPDLIILDLMMPGMSGFEVVEELKRHPTASDIPVVIFTAKDLTREEVMRLGQEVEKVLAKGMTSRTDLLRELRSLELLYPIQARLMDRVLRCYNPRYKQLRLSQECSRSKRYAQQFSIVGWEMDGFNDYVHNYGRRWGVVALKDIVELVQVVTRKGDVLVRSSEADFTLILPGITPLQAERVAEKIRIRIKLHRFPLAGGKSGRFTASFGCAHFGVDGETVNDLTTLLHKRIVQAINSGGDCSVCFEKEKS